MIVKQLKNLEEHGMVGIIGAMDNEVNLIKEEMKISSTVEVAGRTFYVGELNDRDIVLVKAGIGKVNAGLTTTILFEKFPIDYIINTGCAGGINPAKQCELIISEGTCYHDVIIPGNKKGQVQDLPLVFPSSNELTKKAIYVASMLNIEHRHGIIATGDKFVTEMSMLKDLQDEGISVIACDMEGAAIGQVCYEYNKPFIIVRSISDVVDSKEQLLSYNKIADKVCNDSARFVMEIIK